MPYREQTASGQEASSARGTRKASCHRVIKNHEPRKQLTPTENVSIPCFTKCWSGSRCVRPASPTSFRGPGAPEGPVGTRRSPRERLALAAGTGGQGAAAGPLPAHGALLGSKLEDHLWGETRGGSGWPSWEQALGTKEAGDPSREGPGSGATAPVRKGWPPRRAGPGWRPAGLWDWAQHPDPTRDRAHRL